MIGGDEAGRGGGAVIGPAGAGVGSGLRLRRVDTQVGGGRSRSRGLAALSTPHINHSSEDFPPAVLTAGLGWAGLVLVTCIDESNWH